MQKSKTNIAPTFFYYNDYPGLLARVFNALLRKFLLISRIFVSDKTDYVDFTGIPSRCTALITQGA